jgi:hypothetical protein
MVHNAHLLQNFFLLLGLELRIAHEGRRVMEILSARPGGGGADTPRLDDLPVVTDKLRLDPSGEAFTKFTVSMISQAPYKAMAIPMIMKKPSILLIAKTIRVWIMYPLPIFKYTIHLF